MPERARRYLVVILALLIIISLPSSAQGEPPPTPEPDPVSFVIWWPEPLAPLGNTEIEDYLFSVFDGFEAAENGQVRVEFRRKAVDAVGGIMPTLRTGSTVAPGALPAVTIIRRDNLLSAEQGGLVVRLEGRVTSAVVAELGPGLALGQIDNVLYGLPYLLIVNHMIYRNMPDNPVAGWRFEDVLEWGEPFLFAANRASGLNTVFLVQYLDAGGTLSGQGDLQLNPDALFTVLDFYETARQRGLIDESVLTYTNPSEFESAFIDSSINAGIFNSSIYLTLQDDETDLRTGYIPTLSGAPTSVLDGWVWVITSSDTQQQEIAERFFAWMMDPDRQEAYARLVHRLPSQQSVLRRWFADDTGNAVNVILENSLLPLPETASGPLARAMQAALVSVISGELTAAEATQQVIDQTTE